MKNNPEGTVKFLKSKKGRILVGCVVSVLPALPQFLINPAFGIQYIYGMVGTIFLIVVCTAGVGIFLVGLFLLLIGTISCELIIFLFFRNIKVNLFESNAVLEKYILNAKEYGLPREETSKRLISAGWHPTIVSETLQKIYQ